MTRERLAWAAYWLRDLIIIGTIAMGFLLIWAAVFLLIGWLVFWL